MIRTAFPRLPFITSAILLLSGCASAVNTLPPLTTSEDPIERLTLYVPEGLEIQSVDFDAAVFSDAEPGTTTVSGEVGGRSFVKAYAIERATGAQFLLIYENISERQRPIQVIRFEERPLP